jgi:hypothetical protein
VSGGPAYRYSRCPRCGCRDLPAEQSLPAACPDCGVILAKAGQRMRRSVPADADTPDEREPLAERLLAVPDRVDPLHWWLRALLLAGFALWGLRSIGLDHRSGELFQSFIHGPLLVFHEAGHVLFMPFGEGLMVAGGTLMQLLVPAVLMGALLLKNRDAFGAAIGLWLLGVSLLDVAPYIYDALQPQLVLLGGATGEEGGHDWIHLLSSLGLLPRAQAIGTAVHRLGSGVVLLSLLWAGAVLWRQRRHLAAMPPG